MNLKVVFIANAIIGLVFGVLFLIAPGIGTGLYGAELSEAGLLVTRLFGASMIGYSSLTWLVRNAEGSDIRNAIVTSLFIGWGIGLIFAVIFQIQGVVNFYGWVNVAIYLLFTLGYGYFLFVRS